MSFRQDINGLRAVAVAIVVAYHFGVPGFGGGFLGVDVFFVISGFLMATIIARGLAAERFGLRDFYAARARRIVPALVALTFAVLAVAALFLDPSTADDTARNAVSSLLFVSSAKYALETGYFGGAADTNWLLHTWSLSTEWQFYLLYPLVLIAASKSRPLWHRRLLGSVVVTCLLLVTALWVVSLSRQHLEIGFYVLPTRAWEMLAGTCVAFAAARSGPPERLRSTLATLGVTAILASAFLVRPTMSWPSLWTLAPVLGTALVLYAEQHDAAWARWAPVRLAGEWSYSIYLWHWPIVMGMRYFEARFGPGQIAAGIAASVVLAALSYSTVEAPFRRRVAGAHSRRGTLLSSSYVIVLAFGVLVAQQHGLREHKLARLPPDVVASMAAHQKAAADWTGGKACPTPLERLESGRVCRLGPNTAKRTLVIGDSFAEQIIPRYARRDDLPRGITVAYGVACPPLPGLNRNLPGYDCAPFVDRAYALAATGRFDRVVITSAWQVYLPMSSGPSRVEALCAVQEHGCAVPDSQTQADALIAGGVERLRAILRQLQRRGAQTLVLGPYPTTHSFGRGQTASSLYSEQYRERRAIRLQPISREQFRRSVQPALALLAPLTDGTGAELFMPEDSFCRPDCSPYSDGELLYKDGHHIRASLIGSERFDFYDELVLGHAPAARPRGAEPPAL